MNTRPMRNSERDETPTLIPDVTRNDVSDTLNFGKTPDIKLKKLMDGIKNLPAKISHSTYNLQLRYVFAQMEDYVNRGILVKNGRHYEPVKSMEEDGQKIMAAFNKILKELKERDTKPEILLSDAA